MQNLFIRLIVLFFLLLSASAVHARELKFVYNSFPPYHWKGYAGAEGETIDLLKKIVKKAGHTVSFENIPWSRALRMAKDGDVDGMMGLYKTPLRARDLIYSKIPLGHTKDIIISAAKSNIPPISKYSNLLKYKVGLLQDNSYGKEFDKLKLSKDYSCTTEDHIIKKLLQDRFEIAIISMRPLFHYLKKMKINPNKIKTHPLIISKEGLYYALSRKIQDRKKIMSELDAAHESILNQK
ncbi:MAG: transporter substrate-binding domain-containing protein [Bacteriovoracaceae bacterium]|nr:transporter substrate-binding domain-containing protein [Bacteriovoracaceae bacterium]